MILHLGDDAGAGLRKPHPILRERLSNRRHHHLLSFAPTLDIAQGYFQNVCMSFCGHSSIFVIFYIACYQYSQLKPSTSMIMNASTWQTKSLDCSYQERHIRTPSMYREQTRAGASVGHRDTGGRKPYNYWHSPHM